MTINITYGYVYVPLRVSPRSHSKVEIMALAIRLLNGLPTHANDALKQI